MRLRQNVAFALAIASHLFLWGVYAFLAATNAVGRDAGAFLLAGRLLVRGVPLYQGVWDHKGPVVYLVNALGTSVTRDSIAGVLLLECVMISAALLWLQRVSAGEIVLPATSELPLNPVAGLTARAVGGPRFLTPAQLADL